MDKFEEQIRANRQSLDTLEQIPTKQLWTGIDERMGSQRSATRLRVYQRWLVAASILLLLTAGLAVLGWHRQPANVLLLSNVSPELAQQEMAYLQTISQKEASLRIQELDQEAYAPFFEELHLLDSIKTEYQRELPNFGANERLLNTIIRYYELKIHLLEQLENDLAKQQYYGISNTPTEI